MDTHVILNDVVDRVPRTVAHSLTSYVAQLTALHVNATLFQQLYDVDRFVTGETVVVPHHPPHVVACRAKFSQSVTTKLYVHAVHGMPSKSATHLFLLDAIVCLYKYY